MDCLGAYGNQDVKTPHIDGLAADGERFVHSFCPFPVCTPSRYSLLSGLYAHEHGGWSNHCSIAAETATFPKILRAGGYKTKAIGKMHFTPTYLDVGFDEMELSEQDGPGRWDDDYHRYLMARDLVDSNDLEDQRSEFRRKAGARYFETFGAMESNLSDEHSNTTWIGDRVAETLEGWDEKQPSLLMAGFVKPHHPFDPPAPWDTMYDPEKLALLPGWTETSFEHDLKYSRGYFDNASLTEPAMRKVMAYYYATISQIDFQVGRMIKILKDKGLYDNTLIIYTSDHGDYMGYHHMILKGNYLYEALAKVPLIIKWPKSKNAGTVSSKLVNNIDLAPTICHLVQLPPAKTMRGKDLAKDPGHDIIFCESGPNQVMARTQRYKLILAGPRNANLFYDLEADPLERNNLYDNPAYQDRIAELETKLNDWRRVGPWPEPSTEGPIIKGENVPPADLSHRGAIIDYYTRKMAEMQTR